MILKRAYPCPCGGKVKWKKEKIVRDGIDCGILDIEYCPKCGEEYLPETSAQIVETSAFHSCVHEGQEKCG